MIFNGEYGLLSAYCRDLANLMGLRDWQLRISEDRPDDKDSSADCAPIYGR